MNSFPSSVELIEQTVITFPDRDSIVVPSWAMDAYMCDDVSFVQAFYMLGIEDWSALRDILEPEADIDEMADTIDVQDQAIDAFMDDREVLLEELREQHLMSRILAEGIETDIRIRNDLMDENDNLQAILTRAATFVGKAKEMLLSIGIKVETAPDGDPLISINRGELFSAFV